MLFIQVLLSLNRALFAPAFSFTICHPVSPQHLHPLYILTHQLPDNPPFISTLVQIPITSHSLKFLTVQFSFRHLENCCF